MSGFRDRARALAVAVGVVVAAIAVGSLLPQLVLVAISQLGGELSVSARIGLLIVLTQGVAFGGVAGLYLGLRSGHRPRIGLRVPTASDGWWMAVGTAAALGGMILGSVVASALGVETGTHQISEVGVRDPRVFATLIPLSFILIGPGEELLFRGVVQGRLREAFGPVAAVALAALVFALVHVIALTGPYGGRLAAVAILLVPSLVFGIAYERTGNLVVPAVIHGAYNAALLAMAYAAATSSQAA